MAQVGAAPAGAELYLGWFFAGVFTLACLGFRFTLPLSIAAYFGAHKVWEWSWLESVLFVAPGLLLMIPGVLLTFILRLRAVK